MWPLVIVIYLMPRTKNYYQKRTSIQYEGNIIPNHHMTNFLGIIMDETLTWNKHTDSTAKKLCTASYFIRNLKHILSPTSLKTLYYAYIHPIISYGIIFWGRASKVTKLFTLQKRIRIITDKRPRNSCREALRKMEILTLHSQYLYSLIIFTVENNNQSSFNKDIHLHNTRHNTNIHLPIVNLSTKRAPIYQEVKHLIIYQII
jgi:hypothetical protein